MFVGVSASRVRDMFEQGKKTFSLYNFIDEIDAVGRSEAGLEAETIEGKHLISYSLK